jgi:hypothetical protein
MVFSWLTNCMVNELSISYETVLASSHFPREHMVLGSNCFFKTLRTFWFWFKDFKFFDRTSSPVLDLVLYISRPPLPGSFFFLNDRQVWFQTRSGSTYLHIAQNWIVFLISGGRPEASKRNLNFQSATWHHLKHLQIKDFFSQSIIICKLDPYGYQVEHIFKHSFFTMLHMLNMLYQGFFLRILWHSQSGHHSQNNLAKFGYILDMKVPQKKNPSIFLPP